VAGNEPSIRFDRTRRFVVAPPQSQHASQAVARAPFDLLRAREVQSRFREVNEEILAVPGASVDGQIEVLCECGNYGCCALLQIAVDDYERMRGSPARFVVKPGHVAPEGERIALETPGFVVVEQLGPAGQPPALLESRGRPSRRRRPSGLTLAQAGRPRAPGARPAAATTRRPGVTGPSDDDPRP
jgi:hypothetical protein